MRSNPTLMDYVSSVQASAEPTELARRMGMTDAEGLALEGARSRFPDDYETAAALAYASNQDSDPASTAQALRSTWYRGDAVLRGAQHTLSPGQLAHGYFKRKDPSFFKKALEVLIKPAELLAIPQQMMYQRMVSGDWRNAIPDWMVPGSKEEQWEAEGVHHQFLTLGDVIDETRDNEYSTMMEDLKQDGWFKKWVVRGTIGTGAFVADALFDPMNIVAGAGLGRLTTNLMRRALPASIRAPLVASMAKRGTSLVKYDAAIEEFTELVQRTSVKAASGLPDDIRRHRAAIDGLVDLVDSRERLRLADDLYARAPHTPSYAIADAAEDATDFERARVMAAKRAAEDPDTILAYDHLPDSMKFLRSVLGPDDAEMAGDALRRMAGGMGVDDVSMRSVLFDVEPARTSGVINNPTVKTTMGLVDDLANVEGTVAQRVSVVDDLIGSVQREAKDALRREGKPLSQYTSKVTNGGRAASIEETLAALKAEKAELVARRKAVQKAIKRYGKTGQLTDEMFSLSDNYRNLPWGPRRDLFSTDAFMSARFGDRLHSLWGKALYPGSWRPKPGLLTFSYFFREPMRVLEEYLPGSWGMIRRGMLGREVYTNSTIGRLDDIFVRHGIKTPVAKKATKVAGLQTQYHINKDADRLLYQLLDTKAEDLPSVMARLNITEDSAVKMAHDEVRVVLNEIADKMGLPQNMRVDGYITRAMKVFNEGTRPHELMGLRKVDSIPWFKRERLVDDVVPDVGAIEALDVYVRGTSKHMYTDPSLRQLEVITERAIRNGQFSGNDVAKIRTYVRDLTANMNGEPSSLGRYLDRLPLWEGGADHVRKTAAGVGLLTYSAALTGNPRYPIMSMLQAFNTTGSEFGVLRTLRSMVKSLTPEGQQLSAAAGLRGEHLKMFEGMMSKFSSAAADLRPLMPGITDTEFAIRGVTFHASLGAQLDKLGLKSLDEIADPGTLRNVFDTAIRDSESINHVFGVLGRPQSFGRFSSSGSAFGTQFMSFPIKQTETIWAHTKNNPGFLWDYLVMAGQIVHIGHKANVSVEKYVGLGYGEDLLTEQDITSMPVEVAIAAANIGLTMSNLGSVQTERDAAIEDFNRALENLLPGRAWFRWMDSIVEKAGGEVRDRQGRLVRRSGGVETEAASMLTGMQSLEDKHVREVRQKERELTAERSAAIRRIRRAAEESIREGKAMDFGVIAEAAEILAETGTKVTPGQIQKWMQDADMMYTVTEHMRSFYGNKSSAAIHVNAERVVD